MHQRFPTGASPHVCPRNDTLYTRAALHARDAGSSSNGCPREDTFYTRGPTQSGQHAPTWVSLRRFLMSHCSRVNRVSHSQGVDWALLAASFSHTWEQPRFSWRPWHSLGDSLGDSFCDSLGDSFCDSLVDDLVTPLASLGDSLGDSPCDPLGDSFGDYLGESFGDSLSVP